MKFAFFGSPDVARDTLKALIDAGYTPVVVVTNPDAPKGRGRALTPTATKEYAEEKDIPVLTPERLDAAAQKEIFSYDPEYAIVVAYGKILPEALISAFPQGVLNIHYSLLPKYRGASPVETALLHGETTTGVTIQKMQYELDAGDILAQKEIAIRPDDTTKTLRPRLIEEGARLLIETLPHFEAGTITPTPQDESAATYAPKLKKEDGELSLTDPDEINWNKYRAYAVWPGTYFFKNGKRIKITNAEMVGGKFTIRRIIPEGKKETDY